MMNRLALCALLSTAACAAGPDDRSGSRAPLSPAAIDDRAASLRAFEQQIEDAVSRRDADFLDRATAATFVRTGPDGKVEDRATVMALIRQPPPSSDIIRRTIDPASQQVQIHGDIAISRGNLEIRGPRRASRVEYVRVYRRRGPAWDIVSFNILSTTPLTP